MFDSLHSTRPSSLATANANNNTKDQISDEDVKELLKLENNSLRIEISELKKELDELQDSFRIRDAEEFQRVQVELELSNKKCRIFQYRLIRIEKRNDELLEEKTRIEECLAMAQEQIYKVEELEDELVIAKEVSVRLHKELEESEELRTVADRLNKSLRQQYDSIHEHAKNLNLPVYSDCFENRLFVDLHDSLYREYALNEKLCEQSQEIKLLQTKQGTSRSEIDQKLALMHGYVCRLREAIDEKDATIRALTSELQNAKKGTGVDEEVLQPTLSSSQSTPDLINSAASEKFAITSIGGVKDSCLLLWRCANKSTLTAQESTTLMPSSGLSDASTQSNFSVSPSESNTTGAALIGIASNTSPTNKQDIEVDQQSEVRNLRTRIKQQAVEIEDMRKGFNDYLKLKQDLETSLQEAGELIISRDTVIEKVREENSRIRQQFSAEHTRLVDEIKRLDDELRECHRQKAEVQKKHHDQLHELKELEDSYYGLGQKLNQEVSQLTKQISQLNADKEKLETSFNKLKESKKKNYIDSIALAKNPSLSSPQPDMIRREEINRANVAPVDKGLKSVYKIAEKASEQKAAQVKEVHNSNPTKVVTGIPVPKRSGKQISRSLHGGSQKSSSSSPDSSMSQSLPLSANKSVPQRKHAAAFNRWISATSSVSHPDKQPQQLSVSTESSNITNRAHNLLTKLVYHRRSKSRQTNTTGIQEASNCAAATSAPPSNIPRPTLKLPKSSEMSTTTTNSSIKCQSTSKIPVVKKSKIGYRDPGAQSEISDNISGLVLSSQTSVEDVDSLLSRVTSTARPLMIDG